MVSKIRDNLLFIKSLTFRKVANIVKANISYHYSIISRNPVVCGMPYGITIEPTTFCNLNCPECPKGAGYMSRPQGKMDLEFYKQIIDIVHPYATWLMLYFQGEPFMHPGFTDIIGYATTKKIYTVTSTNCQSVNRDTAEKIVLSGLNRLIISVDGPTRESYEAYRKGGSLDKVIQGTREIIQIRSNLKRQTPYVVFQCIVTKYNQNLLNDVKKLGISLGVDKVVFKSAQIADPVKGYDLIPDLENFSRYRKLPDGAYSIKSGLKNRCRRLWQTSVITWDGRILPCCFDKDAEYEVGDLKTEEFAQIWKGKLLNGFRLKTLENRKGTAICCNCTEGLKM